MPTWRQVAAVAAGQRWDEERRRERLAEQRRARPARPRVDDEDDDHGFMSHLVGTIEFGRRFATLEYPDPYPTGNQFTGELERFGPGDRGQALTIADRLCRIDAERETLCGQHITRVSDDRRRTAQLRALTSESEQLAAQLETKTPSWWPEQLPAGRTAARTAAMPGVNAPGPAPRAFLPK